MLSRSGKGQPLSLINRCTEWLISLLEFVESGSGIGMRLLIAIAGIFTTIAIWVFHLNHSSFLLGTHGIASKILLFFILAPTFLTVVSLVYILFPSPDPKTNSVNGPLSSYLQREKNDRRRKILIVAGIVSAINLLLIILSSSVQE